MKTLAFVIVMALALSACGASLRPPDETTETWTSGDDEALGIVAQEDDPSRREAGGTD